jgi:hypothetical protein
MMATQLEDHLCHRKDHRVKDTNDKSMMLGDTVVEHVDKFIHLDSILAVDGRANEDQFNQLRFVSALKHLEFHETKKPSCIISTVM